MSDLINALLRILQLCWSWIHWFLPFKMVIVNKGELGVRFTCGTPGPNLEAGVHVGTSLQEMHSIRARLCKVELESLRFYTQDRVPLIVWATATFDVTDAGNWLSNSADPVWLLSELLEAETRDAMMGEHFDTILSDLSEVELKAKNQAQSKVDEFELGACIRYIRIKHIIVANGPTETALSAGRICAALMDAAPEDTRWDPAFPSLVALASSATPVNALNNYTVSSTGEVTTEAEEYYE